MKVTKKTRWEKSALMLVFVLALLAGFVLAGCLGSGDDGNPFIGTWYGYSDGDRIRVVVDDSTWIATLPDYPSWGYETGTYTHSGNSGTFFQDGYAIGTATVSGNTITATSSYFGGTFILTR